MKRTSQTALILLLTCFAGTATANLFPLSGCFSQDDAVALFNVSVLSATTVTFQTTSYATGGFDPLLTLFDGAGNYLTDNNDRGSTANDWDAYLSLLLGPGEYILALTQSDNAAIQPTLADGFSRIGQPDFTSAAFGLGQPGRFWDATPTQRTGSWALQIEGADGASEVSSVPEPSGIPLLGTALLGLIWLAWRRSAKRI